MFALSKTTNYAIRALVCLADSGRASISIEQVAARSGVPRPYLAKSVRRWAATGIVATKRGAKGGLWLARPPQEITLLDISIAVDGEDYLCQCLLGEEHCSDERDCPTHEFWKKARQQIRRKLQQTTLADVLDFERRQKKAKARPAKSPKRNADGATAEKLSRGRVQPGT